MNQELSDNRRFELVGLVNDGHREQAVERHRDFCGSDLESAIQAIEQLEAEYRVNYSPITSEKKRGCLAVLALLTILVLVFTG